jgi:4-azaleucine resistance transporter AzlC
MAGHRREGLLLAIAVGVVGVTFGVLADAAGLTLPQIIVMSTLVFTGASQFAAVSVIDGGGSSGAAVGSAMLLAARNALYGPVVARLLETSGLRALGAHLVIDETTAMASVQDNDVTAADAFWWTGIWLWSLWNLGSIGGALLGAALGEPETWGLDAAFPAAFIALLVPHLRTQPGRVAAILGGAVAIVMVPIAPAGVPLLVAALAVVPAVWWKTRLEAAT